MFDTLIENRRSVRSFLPTPVEPEKIDQLVEAALRAPASMSRNPWEFVVITDRETLEKLSKAKTHGSAFLSNAPLGIVVCADPAKSDVWIEDASIASLYLLLTAEDLGLGSCWIQIRHRNYSETMTSQEYVSQVLNLPPDFQVLSIVAIGYAQSKNPPHQKHELQYEKVYLNSYGNRYISQ